MGARLVTARQRRRYAMARTPRRRPSGLKRRLLAMLILPAVLWLGWYQLQALLTQPQAVLVLGGATEREKFAAQFAREHPGLPIWISSGAPQEYSEWVFSEAGVELSRLKLDYRAVDTLTNFTTLADDLKQRGIKSVYLITSAYHMRRSRLIGEIVLGSRGIHLQPVEIPSGQSPESLSKTLRDGGRALVWVTTGYTGAELHQQPVATP
jgi:uncharacterized SAM-binding protein YcdF (DUF218 family)